MSNRTCTAALIAALVLATIPAWSYKGSGDAKLIDTGSFGIFVRGRRVGTETFSVQQKSDSSIIAAQLKIEDGNERANQHSELQLASNGDLRHYDWHETIPEKAQATVIYKDEFLVETVTSGPGKPVERAFMMPPSTVILDDFFTHRQILLWRYLATFCGPTVTPQGCKLEPAKFGVLMPREQATIMVSVTYNGKEKLAVHGAQQELDRFTLQTDEKTWTFWLQGSYPFKMVRVLVPADGVEVLRD